MKRLVGASVVVALLGLALMIAGHLVIARAADGRVYERAATAPERSVAIVLGARVFRDGRLSKTTTDRVLCGVALYREGRVRRVLVSGDHGHQDYDEVSAMGAALVRAGVPSNRVFLDHAGFRTLATMHRAREVFGVRDAAICSQRFHLPRSIYLARRFGIDAVGVVADRRRYRADRYNQMRESAARAAAFVDVLFGREASLLGPPIPISGDGRITHDRPL
jgi:SanA protein